MKTNPIARAQLLLVVNATGGCSKSTCAAEARVACVMEGIPFRLVTFDPCCQRLHRTFRGDGVNCIAKANGVMLPASFSTQINEIRQSGGVIIADMPSAFADSDSSVVRAIMDSGILSHFESIGLLIPVTHSLHHIEGALDAVAALKAAGIKHDCGLIRARQPEETYTASWDKYPEFAQLRNQFPIWHCPFYLRSLEDMMDGRGDFADYPALDKLPTMLAEEGHALSTLHRGQLRAAVNHLESARQAIRTHLLAPIMERTNPSKA